MIEISFSGLSYKYQWLLASIVSMTIIIYFMAWRSKKKRTLRFGNFETLEKVMGGPIFPTNMMMFLPLFLNTQKKGPGKWLEKSISQAALFFSFPFLILIPDLMIPCDSISLYHRKAFII